LIDEEEWGMCSQTSYMHTGSREHPSNDAKSQKQVWDSGYTPSPRCVQFMLQIIQVQTCIRPTERSV